MLSEKLSGQKEKKIVRNITQKYKQNKILAFQNVSITSTIVVLLIYKSINCS